MSDPKAALEASGFDRVLIWFSQEEYVRQVAAAPRASAEAAARRQGMDERAITALGDRVVAARRLDRLALDAREAQVVPHELGHGWFTKSYWPNHQFVPDAHYGGPGPDWLDEVAAMLMESGGGSLLPARAYVRRLPP